MDGRYKILITVLASLVSFLALGILTLPVSPFVGILAWSSLIFSILLLLEAYALELRLEENMLMITFFGIRFYVLPVNDIIAVECGLFSTKLMTLWKKLVLPPLEPCSSLVDLCDPLKRRFIGLRTWKNADGNTTRPTKESQRS